MSQPDHPSDRQGWTEVDLDPQTGIVGEARNYDPYNSTAWWTISSDKIMEMLYAVKNGRSPESVYVQAYNEASHDDYSGPQGQ